MIYRLDAMEAYNKKLVKKIAVKGISVSGSTATEGYLYLQSVNLSKDKAPTATLEFDMKGASGIRKATRLVTEGYNVFAQSGELEEYRTGFVVTRIDGRDNSVSFANGKRIVAGDVLGEVSEEQLRRIQIRETILSHLERERMLFARGIKVWNKETLTTNLSTMALFIGVYEQLIDIVIERVESFLCSVHSPDKEGHIKSVHDSNYKMRLAF